MSELQAFGEGISPEMRALAQALRDLFAGLEISERRYAARRSYDSSTVSRYLSGQRLPPWEFALNLLNDIAEMRGTVPTAETTEMLRALHHAALRSGKSPTHKVQLLQQQLAVADEDARRAAQRERWLEDTLRDREHRVRELQLQIGGFRTGPDPDADRTRLIAEIQQLKDELEETREAHRQAEERCERLERQLAEAETRQRGAEPDDLVAVGPGPADIPGPMSAGTIIHGDVFVNTSSSWRIDEETVGSVTVEVAYQYRNRERRTRVNGLLVGPTTVVVPQLLSRTIEVDWRITSSDGKGTTAEIIEYGPEPFVLTVMRLAEPLANVVPSIALGQSTMPGSQLLVNAHARDETGRRYRHSGLLEVKGRSGPWVRVEGELPVGLTGAPAFHVGTGELIGLVAKRLTDGGSKAHLIPAGALLDLEALP
ncbi:hypothetical protein [Streptomyces hesseae]|uniref:Uncharacterized protein n=1 Tax=Streptomyces hesseae TaxID=3075519 RepID=A0ABU2SJA2_9ACTN|nr:hypothetical protein [Streptomyces sp. DSM 40473]MDT0448987.1 hypothetical protein [Streptomyces sp. DSM 40473]